VNGDLKAGAPTGIKYANYSDSYNAQIALRDAYGNAIQMVPGVKNVEFRVDINSSLDFSSIPLVDTYKYGNLLASLGFGEAF
jgi:hypothetical protein